MSKFQAGDIVVGNERANTSYLITKTGCVIEVLDVLEHWFSGRLILNSPGKAAAIGRTFALEYENFDLKESMIQENE